MKLKIPLILFFLFTFLLVFSAQDVFACSCMVSPTVDIAFKQTPNVVIVKLDELQTKKNPFGGGEEYFLSKMTVKKVFKGNFKVGQSLKFGTSGTSCDYTFAKELVGTEWLFYLYKSDKSNVWYYPACTRSDSVESSTNDLKYLENISNVQGKTRLSGTVTQQIESAIETGISEYKKLSDRNIHIVGNGRDITLKTDENGDYEIYDLPAGKYKLTIEPLAGYKTSPFDLATVESTEIQIRPNQHTEKNFEYSIDNSISGKFFDSNQKLLKDVCLDLYPAEGEKIKYFRNFDCTDEKGEFKFSQIPAGKYIIVVNNDGEIDSDEPFGTFYYPNKLKKEEAQIITIGAGEHLKDLVITAPTTAEVITVKGVLLFEDGKPAIDESVEFFSFDSLEKQKDKEYKTEDSRANTNENGQFEIRILKGQRGKLLGTMMSFEGEYEKCPKLEKLISAKDRKGLGVTDIETPSIEIDALKNLEGFKLIFPFPSCKKAKIE